jgi:hypothetical protein
MFVGFFLDMIWNLLSLSRCLASKVDHTGMHGGTTFVARTDGQAKITDTISFMYT